MQLNQPNAKICIKSDSNWLLIDFFDTKLSPDVIKIVAGCNQNCCDDSNLDPEFKSEFDSYRKLVEFNQTRPPCVFKVGFN